MLLYDHVKHHMIFNSKFVKYAIIVIQRFKINTELFND